MSVSALKHEIASLLDYGHLHVTDAQILTSQKVLGAHTSAAEHALLRDFKDQVEAGYITSSPDARKLLSDVVLAGPTGLVRYAASVAMSSLTWGVGLAAVGAAIGAGGAFLSGGGDWRGLAMVAGGTMGAAAGAGTGLLVGTFRATRD